MGAICYLGAYIKHLDKFIIPNWDIRVYNIDYRTYQLIPDNTTITNWNLNWWEHFFYSNAVNITYFEKRQKVAVLGINNWDEVQPYHTIGTFSDNLPSDAPLKGTSI